MPTIAARQGRAHLTTPEEKGTPQIKIHYFKLINNHLKHIPYITPPSPILFSRVSLSLSETMPVTNTTTPTVAEHIKWRRPRNQFNHHHHHHHHPIFTCTPLFPLRYLIFYPNHPHFFINLSPLSNHSNSKPPTPSPSIIMFPWKNNASYHLHSFNEHGRGQR